MHEIQSLGLLDHDVVSSIIVPFLSGPYSDGLQTPMQENVGVTQSISKAEAERFDLDIFSLKRDTRSPVASRNSLASSGSGTIMSSSYRSNEKRSSNQLSNSSRMIPPIEESPRIILSELPQQESESRLSMISLSTSGSSPSRSSVRSARSTSTTTSVTATSEETSRRTKLKFAPSWLFSPFRSGISQPQTSAVSASSLISPTGPSAPSTSPSITINSLTDLKAATPRTPKPVNIQQRASPRSSTYSRTLEEDNFPPHRNSLSKNSPLGTPPRDDSTFGKRRGTQYSTTNTSLPSSLHARTNPSHPTESVSYGQSSLARRWQHIFPEPLSKKEIKWKSMVAPACLPLTVEHFPTKTELESSYDVFSYGFVVDPPEMRSFLVKPPSVKGSKDEIRKAWAGAVMREMVALRLAQGFQFVLRASSSSTKNSSPVSGEPDRTRLLRQSHGFGTKEDLIPQAEGAADVLNSTHDPVYLSMSNEIHRIAYIGDSIQVRRYVRRMPVSQPIEYQCLIWPKLGVGYTELKTSFVSHGLEHYGWNR
jgi:DEP domain-containing protein 5